MTVDGLRRRAENSSVSHTVAVDDRMSICVRLIEGSDVIAVDQISRYGMIGGGSRGSGGEGSLSHTVLVRR